MKKNFYINLAAVIAVLILVAVFSTSSDKESEGPQKPKVSETDRAGFDPSISAWGLKVGMTSKEAFSILGIDKEMYTGSFFCCSECAPEDWTGKFCTEHCGPPEQGAKGSDQVMAGFFEGKINSIGSPVLERDGKIVLREGDSLEKARALFPEGRVEKRDEVNTIIFLPGAWSYIEFFEDRVLMIQLGDRPHPSQ